MRNQKVCVVGLGYIGLPTSAILANSGYRVHGVDVSHRVVDTINAGNIHIVEHGLDIAVRSAVTSGMFTAHLEPVPADVFMICVPTPFEEAGDIPVPNLDYVVAASKAIAPHVSPGNIVILESTSPVGTTELIRDTLAAEGVDVDDIAIAYCPERVLPGKIMKELVENDRIVGGINPLSTAMVRAFYQTFVSGDVIGTDCRTAEMCKLVENSFRDVNIAFANELSILADKLQIDVAELIRLANRHPRVNILQPGPGVGGHCIAVDPWFIVAKDPENARLIRTAREVNNYKTEWVMDKVRTVVDALRGTLGRDPVVACFGLAFKADIDDLRESPARHIADQLFAEGMKVIAVEPHIEKYTPVPLRSIDEALSEADVAVLLVKHTAFAELNLEGKAILDFCGLRPSKPTQIRRETIRL